jgi:hypothetical protein
VGRREGCQVEGREVEGRGGSVEGDGAERSTLRIILSQVTITKRDVRISTKS